MEMLEREEGEEGEGMKEKGKQKEGKRKKEEGKVEKVALHVRCSKKVGVGETGDRCDRCLPRWVLVPQHGC